VEAVVGAFHCELPLTLPFLSGTPGQDVAVVVLGSADLELAQQRAELLLQGP